jgi:hypothetical protein
LEIQRENGKPPLARGLGDKGNLLEEIGRDFVFNHFHIEFVISIVVSIDFVSIHTIRCFKRTMLNVVIPDKFVEFISDELGCFLTGLENISVAIVFNAAIYTGITDDGKK